MELSPPSCTPVSRGRFRRPERATLGHMQQYIQILAVRLISRETTGNNVRRFSFTLIRKRLPFLSRNFRQISRSETFSKRTPWHGVLIPMWKCLQRKGTQCSGSVKDERDENRFAGTGVRKIIHILGVFADIFYIQKWAKKVVSVGTFKQFRTSEI